MKPTYMMIGALAIAAVSAGAGMVWQKSHSTNVENRTVNSTRTIAANMPIKSAAPAGVVQDDTGKTILYWYDPMVPKQRFDKPGKSPFMDMQLEPKYAADNNSDTSMTGMDAQNSVSIPAQTMQNLGLRLATVNTQSFGDSLSAIGRIMPDERRFYAVQTRISGFVEKLLVRAVGDPVTRGQKIAEVYAPELLAAQQEYLALLAIKNGTIAPDLLQAARNRLKLLGMSEWEISNITTSGKASPRFGIYAAASGVVTELGVREGAQIMPGLSLMQISDLSQVWLIAEVPERDASLIKIGSIAEIQLQNGNNQTIKSKVNYLYPNLDPTSRTLQARVELPNKTGNLRIGMYANVTFVGQTHQALAVPTESIIATGVRKVVIVQQGQGYKPVEVITGQEHNNQTEILQGLTEGDKVVASGQFLIDSEASLSGVMEKLVAKPMVNESTNNAMSTMRMDMPATATKVIEKMPHGHGKVTEIDAQSGKITLAHEPIAALGWPAMTMGFNVKDVKSLAKIKVGDTVEFDLKSNPKTEQYDIEQLNKQHSVMPEASRMESKP